MGVTLGCHWMTLTPAADGADRSGTSSPASHPEGVCCEHWTHKVISSLLSTACANVCAICGCERVLRTSVYKCEGVLAASMSVC